MNTTEAIIEEYLAKDLAVNAAAKPLDGLLGFGKGPKDDSCHEEFLRAMEKEAARLIQEDVSDSEAFSAVDTVLRAAQKKDLTDTAKWTLVAAGGYFVPVIGRLNLSEKEALLAWYNEAVPKRMRLPVEKKIAAALN